MALKLVLDLCSFLCSGMCHPAREFEMLILNTDRDMDEEQNLSPHHPHCRIVRPAVSTHHHTNAQHEADKPTWRFKAQMGTMSRELGRMGKPECLTPLHAMPLIVDREFSV